MVLKDQEFKWWRRKYADHPGVWPMYEDFSVFLRLVWDHLGLPEPTPVQLDIADFLQNGPRRGIIMGFRGVGKSYITSAFVCWNLLRDPDMAIMVVSASKVRSDDFSTFTKRLIAEMEVLRHLQAQSGQRDSNIAFDVGPAKAKHSPSVKSVGITGQLTGSRANLIVADDIEVPGNAETQNMRDKIAELVKEFDSVLIPGGRIMYLGTPQTEQSLYNKLNARGYETRIWPAEVPDKDYYDRLMGKLAPYVHERMEAGVAFGEPMDPKRFDKEDLAERKLSYGRSGYALQFLLDTSLSDADRYPLKLRDLIVMPLDSRKGPTSVAWGPKQSNMYHDLVTPGLDGDNFHGPAFTDSRFTEYTGSVMFVDPSGRGTDETVWCVTKLLLATVFCTLLRADQRGYDDEVLQKIAQDAKDQEVNLILVEENFGQGMFEKLLLPHLRAVGHKCAVESIRSSKMKEARMADTLEPIMNQHRLVIAEDVIREDDEQVSHYTPDKASQYRLFFQMSRLTREKGALAHDDRLDALAGSVAHWVDAMARDAQEAAEKLYQKDFDRELKAHFKNQVHKVTYHEKPRRRKKRGSGFALSR